MKRNMKIKVPLVLAVALLSLISLGMVGAAYLDTQADVVKNPTEVPPADVNNGPKTVTVNLDAKEVIAELAPGIPYKFWTFAPATIDRSGKWVVGKATVPGPMIRATVGDTIVINLRNDLSDLEPHNIDFHAVMGPGGGAAVTNVMPGDTATLKFTAMREGAFIYHCAGEGMPWEHVAHGMYGLIQIDPKDGLETGFKEFYVGQSEWYLTDSTVTDTEVSPSPFYDLDPAKASDELPNYYSLNGHTKALADPNLAGNNITVKQGDKVRIFFVTGGPNKGSNFHIIGQIFDKVYTGNPLDFVRNEETVYVAPGSAAVFELTALVPGDYLLVDHALWRVPKGAGGKMHVTFNKDAVMSTCTSILGQVSGMPTGGWNCGKPGSWPFSLYSPIAFGTGH